MDLIMVESTVSHLGHDHLLLQLPPFDATCEPYNQIKETESR